MRDSRKGLFIQSNSNLQSNLQSKAVSLLKYSQTFVTSRPYLTEILNTVYCFLHFNGL